MSVVAFVGADGAGKSTVARAIAAADARRFRYLYSGSNQDAVVRQLPTTRLYYRLRSASGAAPIEHGPPDLAADAAWKSDSQRQRVMASVKRLAWLLVTISEELHLAAVVRRAKRAGAVVLLDRHPRWDYWASDVEPVGSIPLSRRIHGACLKRYARPDLVLWLDAPSEVLFARKGEGTTALIEARRRDYATLAAKEPNVCRVDVSAEVETVVARCQEAIDALPRSGA